jgi:ubiquinone/menaquinone biosynthesis C-methylase UbiE
MGIVKVLVYLAEFQLLRGLLVVSGRPRWEVPVYSADQKRFIEARFWALLRDPAGASTQLSWRRVLRHFQRLWALWGDLPAYLDRKARRSVSEVAGLATDEVPEYLKLNMHFQTDGYFSERSAFLYDHQIEILFLGVAERVRKIAFTLVKEVLPANPVCLEFGCGNGTSGVQFREVIGAARVMGIDPSESYLRVAARDYPGVYDRFLPVAIESLSEVLTEGEQFDLVFGCFTLHEIPARYWEKVFGEFAKRVKPGGHLLILDSQQNDDPLEAEGPNSRDSQQFFLDRFQDDFYEPYYPEYRAQSLDAWAARFGFEKVRERSLLLSKAGVFQRKTIE